MAWIGAARSGVIVRAASMMVAIASVRGTSVGAAGAAEDSPSPAVGARRHRRGRRRCRPDPALRARLPPGEGAAPAAPAAAAAAPIGSCSASSRGNSAAANSTTSLSSSSFSCRHGWFRPSLVEKGGRVFWGLMTRKGEGEIPRWNRTFLFLRENDLSR